MTGLVTELATDLDLVLEIRRDSVSRESDDPLQHHAILLILRAL